MIIFEQLVLTSTAFTIFCLCLAILFLNLGKDEFESFFGQCFVTLAAVSILGSFILLILRIWGL